MANVQPFRIDIPQARLDRLKQKLALSDFPDEVEGVGWDRGVPLGEIKRLVAFWENEFDWRRTEAELNKLPQFTADIQVEGFETLKIHFVHQKSSNQNAVPLLFVHGWPGSFDEVTRILPQLTDPADDEHAPAFDVVAPSLPGFGFSEGSRRPGFTIGVIGKMMDQLMHALGYDKYVTQGGDIGCFVTRLMGADIAQSVRASHINMPRPDPPRLRHGGVDVDLFVEAAHTPLTEKEKAGIRRAEWFSKEGRGYNVQQATKPQTIGYAVADSPVGLLAWVYEKLHDWTDAYPWTDDEVLRWVSIYWFSTAGPAANMRVYYEMYHDPEGDPRARSFEYIKDVPLGTANFPQELMPMPKLWNKTLGPLVLASEWDRGGHFAAFERPDAIVHDLREMFGKGGGAYAVVKGRVGY